MSLISKDIFEYDSDTDFVHADEFKKLHDENFIELLRVYGVDGLTEEEYFSN